MKIVIGQANSIPGDLKFNVDRIFQAMAYGKKVGADLVVLPELMFPGYGLRDDYDNPEVVDEVTTAEADFSDRLDSSSPPVIYGSIEAQNTLRRVPGFEDVSGKPYNIARVHIDGMSSVVRKMTLANDNVFDDPRTFTPGEENQKRIFKLPSGQTIGVLVCAEMWDPDWAAEQVSGVDLIVCINASDWHPGKGETREALAAEISNTVGAPFLYVNMASGQDGILFDGASFLYQNGEITVRLDEFVDSDTLIDTSTTSQAPIVANRGTRIERTYDALVFGLREYFWKNYVMCRDIVSLHFHFFSLFG